MADDDLNDLTFGGAGDGEPGGGFADGQFVSAQIDHGPGDQKPAFTAAQYSFFGAMDDLDGGLEADGGLEDGIDAPPEEDGMLAVEEEEEDLGLIDPDLQATADLGLASMLSGLNVGDNGGAPAGVSSRDQKVEMRRGSAPLAMPSASLLAGLPARGSPMASFGTSPLGGMPPAPQLFAQPVDGPAPAPVPPPPGQPRRGAMPPPPLGIPPPPPPQQPQQPQAPPPVALNELEAALLGGTGGRLMEVQQHQMPPPPGRPPHAPWGGPGPAAGAAPPPPPPQQPHPQAPQAWQPPPPPPQHGPGRRSPSPAGGQREEGRGGDSFGFGYVNKRSHQGYSHPVPHAPGRRPRYRSRYMPEETINHILRIQWAAVHTARPYTEDYYYQAFIAKNFNGANASAFAPDGLREIAPAERAGQAGTTWVPVEGLGKIAMSNIRRPRPLMELSTVAQAEDGAEDAPEGGKAVHKPLEEEPMLAARIMVEDCMCLLLDLDDIERLFKQAAATGRPVEDVRGLVARRAALLEGMAASLRLPDSAAPPTAAGSDAGDGVFLRLMTLPKGRALLASALARLFSPYGGLAGPGGAQARLVWALMRNLRALFGAPPPVDPVMSVARLTKEGEAAGALRAGAMATTGRVAAAAAEAMHRLESAAACVEALSAAVAGDLAPAPGGDAASGLLPLVAPPGVQPADFAPAWLADVLTALLERANVLGLGAQAAAAGGPPLAPDVAHGWEAAFGRLIAMLVGHVGVVLQVFHAAKARGVEEGIRYARAIVPIPLVRAAILHSTEAQRDELRSCLAELS
eukprot:jgi/Tetstr1/437498/TSEL_026177.t1